MLGRRRSFKKTEAEVSRNSDPKRRNRKIEKEPLKIEDEKAKCP